MNLCINVNTSKSEFIKAPLSFVAEMPETPVPVFQSGSSSICLHQLFLAGLVPHPRGATKQCLEKVLVVAIGVWCGVPLASNVNSRDVTFLTFTRQSLLPTSPTNKELFSPNVNGAELRNPDLHSSFPALPFWSCSQVCEVSLHCFSAST